MRNDKMDKLAKKLEKELPEFVSEVQSMSLEQMDTRLAREAKYMEEICDAMEDNEAIKEAADNLKELKGPYLDGKKMVKMKMKYLVNTIKEKGGK
jgi:uncharacterized membrane protein YukC